MFHPKNFSWKRSKQNFDLLVIKGITKELEGWNGAMA